MIGEVVGRRAVVEMGVRDHAHFLKRLEVAIDGGQGQGRSAVSGDGRGEPIRGGVTEPADRINDSLPLPGQPHTPGPQTLAKVLHPCEPTRRSLTLPRAGSTQVESMVARTVTSS